MKHFFNKFKAKLPGHFCWECNCIYDENDDDDDDDDDDENYQDSDDDSSDYDG